MDNTLIAENSGSLYVRYRYQRGEIDHFELLRSAFSYLQFKLGVLDVGSWTRRMMVGFKGRSEWEVEEEAARWFDDLMLQTVYPEAVELVDEHLAAGHVVAIVSGALGFVVRPVAKRLGIEHIIHTRLEVEDGVLTGRVEDPVCFEEGKIYWLEQFIDEHEIDLARSYFYTDSISDLPLLDVVGHPVATNPDPVLHRTARRRGWEVKHFQPPRVDLAGLSGSGVDARPAPPGRE